MTNTEEKLAMEQVLSAIYCRPIFQDFRKPVEVLYPDIIYDYLAVIDEPIDLGTLLLKAKRGKLTVEGLRRGLHLVAENCIKFNGELSIMVNISNHLKMFSCNIFEEVMDLPFDHKLQSEEERNVFNFYKAKERRERFELVQFECMNDSELERLTGAFQDLLSKFSMESSPPGTVSMTTLIQQTIHDITRILNEEEESNEEQDTTKSDYISLADVLCPFLKLCCLDTTTTTNNESSSAVVNISNLPSICPTKSGVIPELQLFMKALDDVVGLLSVFIHERLLRGDNNSTRWVRPFNTIVWAQPPKDGRGRAPWWPAFIVASSSKLYPMNKHVNELNLERLPLVIKKELYKLRPRSNQYSGAALAAAQVQSYALHQQAAAVLQQQYAGQQASQQQLEQPQPQLSVPMEAERNTVSPGPLEAAAPTSSSSVASEPGAPATATTVTATASVVPFSPASTTSSVSAPGTFPVPMAQLPGPIPGTGAAAVMVTTNGVKHRASSADYFTKDSVLVVPDGYLLIEFFGSHDFGWVKAEACSPFKVTTDESTNLHKPNGPPVGLTAAGKPQSFTLCNPDFIKEAVSAALYLQSSLLTCGEAIEEDLDVDLPDLAQLETSITPTVPRINLHGNTTSPGAVQAYLNILASQRFGSAGSAGSGGGGVAGAHSVKRKLNPDGSVDGTPAKRPFTGGSSIDGDGGMGPDGTPNKPVEEKPKQEINPEYEACIVNNVFKVSLVKLTHPRRDSTLYESAVQRPVSSAASVVYFDEKVPEEVLSTLALVDSTHFKANAMARAKAMGYYLEKIKPLGFQNYVPSKHNRATLLVANKNNGTNFASPGEVNKTGRFNAASTGKAARKIHVDSAATKAKTQPGEKRKYTFKDNRVNASAAAAAAAAAFAAVKVKEEQDAQSVAENASVTGGGAGGGTCGDSQNGSIVGGKKQRRNNPERDFSGTHRTPQGTNCFILHTGCSKFYKGEGAIHTRIVDENAAIFHYENKSCEKRKELLRAELAQIKAGLQRLEADRLEREHQQQQEMEQ